MSTAVQAHQGTITMSHDDFSDGTPQKDSDCKEGSVSTTWYKLGTQLLAKRQLKLAAGCFRKAIQCGGKDVPWEAHYNLAACLSSLTDKSEGKRVACAICQLEGCMLGDLALMSCAVSLLCMQAPRRQSSISVRSCDSIPCKATPVSIYPGSC
jgi:hypothetical protein